MKVLGYLMLSVVLLTFMVAPSYLLINYYNTHVNNDYKLPLIKTIAVSFTLALMVSGLMGVDFEGAAFSWLVTVLILHSVVLILGMGVFTLVKYLGKGV